MRITLLTGEYPPQPGGVGDYTRRLGLAFAARGHAVSVLTIQSGQVILYDLVRAGGAAVAADERTVISPSGAGWSPRSWPRLIGAIGLSRPHWLHIQYQTGAYAMSPGINLLPWRLRGLAEAGGPLVAVTFHDLLEPYLFPKAGPLRRWINLRLARDASAVVVTNQADARNLRLAGLAPAIIPIGSNIPVAPPPDYSRAVWRADLGVTPDELLVAYFGLLSPSKGVDLLIEALAGLTSLPWRLLIVGGAATAPQDIAHAEAVHALIARRGLEARVNSSGHVDEGTVSGHLLAADIVALPFRDGASLRRGSLLAALAHGCPTLTTRPADPDTAALLADGRTVALVPPGDAAALAAAIERLATDQELRAHMGEAGRALATRFSWEQIAAQHESLYAGTP